MSYWFKSGILTFADRGIQVLIGLASFYLVVRALGKDDFGTWALFLTITGLLEPFYRGFLSNAAIKFFTENKDQNRAEIQGALIELLLISFVASVIFLWSCGGLISAFFKETALASMLRIHTICLVGLLSSILFDSIQAAHFEFKGRVISNGIRGIIFLSGIVYCMFGNKTISLIYLAYLNGVATLFGQIGNFYSARKFLVFSFKHSGEWIKKMFDFGKFNVASNFSSILFKSADKLMLGRLLNTQSVGVYDVAVRVSNLYEVPTMTLSTIIFPKIVEKNHQLGIEATARMYEKSVGLLLGIILPISVITFVFSDWIVTIIAGKEFIESSAVLQVTIIYGLLVPFNRQFGILLNAIGKPQENLKNIFLILIIDIITNYFFIKSFGTIGAAYGTLSAYVIGVLMGQWRIHKFCKIDYGHIIQNIRTPYQLVYNELYRRFLIIRKS